MATAAHFWLLGNGCKVPRTWRSRHAGNSNCVIAKQESRQPQPDVLDSGMYYPNRQSMLCSQKHCSFWKHCEEEFGGRVRSS